ncbi:metalloregulator ArsR/SmtB family transcription factor [Mesorhizobium sp. STM 4661]|uniref:ArsR/SmtB family transcription factor n=1 Tax=Mesorhizobium sp. STM 4661 TaxID=1297570 RepID=UPI0002BF6536|nr:metalloregulator ArsR/SmtB family transcription factor [Mesorhizobium sp. STM 4661]CCV13920.1 Transcriptional regulator, ArsR family (modular protein) [Mesorhizobium sp. STM 4661]
MISSKPKARLTKQDAPEQQGGTAASAQPLDHSSLSRNEVAILAETFRLLGDPSRLKILLTCLPGPISVGDIAVNLDLSLSLVSHHLRLLRGARLVRGERQAKQIFYEIADQHVSQMLQDMATHISEDHTDE